MKMKGQKIRKGAAARTLRGTRIGKQFTQLRTLLRDLQATTTKIAGTEPPAAVRHRLTTAVHDVRVAMREALEKLRSAESLVEGQVAEMPEPDAEGYYPAAETLRAIIAHQIAERRQKARLSQAKLAKRAGVRQETISRLESGKHSPTVRTVEKIDRVLAQAGT